MELNPVAARFDIEYRLLSAHEKKYTAAKEARRKADKAFKEKLAMEKKKVRVHTNPAAQARNHHPCYATGGVPAAHRSAM